MPVPFLDGARPENIRARFGFSRCGEVNTVVTMSWIPDDRKRCFPEAVGVRGCGRGRGSGAIGAALLGVVLGWVTVAADAADDALSAARKAARFYAENVATEGGYLWRYSSDLSLREGEGVAGTSTIWVQPPGTPAMGSALVRLFRATGDALFLEAAREAADALRRGQLQSGGWQAMIEFDPDRRRRWAYRIDPAGAKKRNQSTLDDDKTQSALRFLMRLDQALEFKDAGIHEMTEFGLNGLLGAQHPNGAFPQVWESANGDSGHPVLSARYPASWPREYPGHGQYWHRYTLNDNLMQDVIETLFLADEIYGGGRFRRAALKAADFLVLAQMPEPQPAWAQQYDFGMRPIWARKFEPPAVTGGESQGVMLVLMDVYRRTGDTAYLAPIPAALAYLRRSLLPDGRLARFYELRTNVPLYFTRDYALTHDDSDMPTHYGFKVGSRLDSIEREYRRLARGDLEERERARRAPDEKAVRAVIDRLDDRGAWVTDGRLRYQDFSGGIIDMNVAVGHFNALADFLSAGGR